MYNKKEWVSKEVITKEALNNIENGIADLDERLEELEDKEVEVDLSDYQEKTDENLVTESKDIVGAINELFQSANNGKEIIADAIGEPLNSEDTFAAMGNDINGLLATFKTNMMNSGVAVESTDKFKSLIDKIKGLTEGEGNKGVQYTEGVIDNFINNMNNSYTFKVANTDETINMPYSTIDIDINNINTFVLDILDVYTASYNNTSEIIGGDILRLIYDGISYKYSSSGVYIERNDNMTIDEFYNLAFLRIGGRLEDYNVSASYMEIEPVSIDGKMIVPTVYSGSVNMGVGYNYDFTIKRANYYAIGVGEEDTTLRDSLASILENKGVDVTEEDDMTSLITKVDSISSGGLDIISATELPTTGRENQICVIQSTPVDEYIITANNSIKTVDTNIVYLNDTGTPIEITNGNQTYIYNIDTIRCNSECLPSYYWNNTTWVELCTLYINFLQNKNLANSETHGGFYSNDGIVAQNNYGIYCPNGLTVGLFAMSYFKNVLDFSSYSKIKIKAYTTCSGNISVKIAYANTPISSYDTSSLTNLSSIIGYKSITVKGSVEKEYTIDIQSWNNYGYMIIEIYQDSGITTISEIALYK